ncbi:kinase-like domain-containing protein [Crucibulum laeve]|uniref:Kinase-like domain-containing protein n=1 Tax=Crucibulum laeve TaxID=68775 RepID=A0A5C3LKJ3_9AGAR|nr:kinase-like domain-containing protein [Crucibulum laeve]
MIKQFNDPALTLMKYCANYATLPNPVVKLQDEPFAYSCHSDVFKGRIGPQKVVVKSWRAASMNDRAKQKFTETMKRVLDDWETVLSHPNVCSFTGISSGFGFLPALVLPYKENGNINEYIRRHPSADILHLMSGVAAGLSYMHSRRAPIVHGRLQGCNILVSDSGEACISDIGIGNLHLPADMTVGMESLNYSRWIAPEIIDPPISGTFDPEAKYMTLKSDVYAFGMTLLEVYTKSIPFVHRRFIAGVLSDVIRGIRPPRPSHKKCPDLTDDIWQLIERCWKQNPKDRPDSTTLAAWIGLISENVAANNFLSAFSTPPMNDIL